MSCPGIINEPSPGRGMRPLFVIGRVGKDHQKIERSFNICGPKYPWPAIDSEINSSRIGLLPGGHHVVALPDHPGVEKSAWGHKWLQGVPLH